MAIRSFRHARIRTFFLDGRIPRKAGWADVARTAQRKLDMLDYASTLMDLASPPGNRLEALKVDLAGCWSVRINARWRVIFRWTDSGPSDVDIVDYH